MECISRISVELIGTELESTGADKLDEATVARAPTPQPPASAQVYPGSKVRPRNSIKITYIKFISSQTSRKHCLTRFKQPVKNALNERYNENSQFYLLLSLTCFFLSFLFSPGVLCDPTDLIWRQGAPFQAMTGRTVFIRLSPS